MKKMTDLDTISRLALDFYLQLEEDSCKNHYTFRYIGKIDDPYYRPPFLEISAPMIENGNSLMIKMVDDDIYKDVLFKNEANNAIFSANVDNTMFIGIQKKEFYIAFINDIYFEELWYKNNKKKTGLKLTQSVLVTNGREVALREHDTMDLLYNKEKETLAHTYYEKNERITEHREISIDEANKMMNKIILSRKEEIDSSFDEIKCHLPNFYRIIRNYKLFNYVNDLFMKDEYKQVYKIKSKKKGGKVND